MSFISFFRCRHGNRKWSVEMEEIEHYHFLKSKTIIIRKRFDDRYVFIPVGVEKTLNEIAPDVVFAMEYNPTILRAVHWCRKRRSRLSAGRTAL